MYISPQLMLSPITHLSSTDFIATVYSHCAACSALQVRMGMLSSRSDDSFHNEALAIDNDTRLLPERAVSPARLTISLNVRLFHLPVSGKWASERETTSLIALSVLWWLSGSFLKKTTTKNSSHGTSFLLVQFILLSLHYYFVLWTAIKSIIAP